MRYWRDKVSTPNTGQATDMTVPMSPDTAGHSIMSLRCPSHKVRTRLSPVNLLVIIQAPQLDINTVAAGGGSRLFYRNGMFVVGPESAGADPGPACYKKGGPLAITDANLVLGRLLPEHL